MHRWLSLLLCIVSLCLIPVTASAHPGRTDANGGHWDNSTGEYHYHHGYSAHDHYDMDGDGVVDCPYDFVDRTGRNSGTPSGSKTSSSIYEKVPAETVTVYKDREVIKEVPYTPTWIKIVIGGLLLLLIVLKIKQGNIKKNLDVKIADHNRSERGNQEMLEQFNADAMRSLGEGYLYRICGTPHGDYLGSDNLPAASFGHDQKWGEKYTFYWGGPTSKHFHLRTCRYKSNMPVNAFTLAQHKCLCTPCSVCRPVLPEMTWVTKYIKYKNHFAKYNVDTPLVDIEKEIKSKKSLENITIEELKERADEMGISSETLLLLINKERSLYGFPALRIEQLCASDFESNCVSTPVCNTKIRKPKEKNVSQEHDSIKIHYRNNQ